MFRYFIKVLYDGGMRRKRWRRKVEKREKSVVDGRELYLGLLRLLLGCLVDRRGHLGKIPFEAHGSFRDVTVALAPTTLNQLALPYTPYIRRMHSLRQQIARATRRAHIINPSFTSTRYLASTRPACEVPQTSSKASDHSAESYLKEEDSSPPADSSTYQVDGSSEAVQRPHKPPSGKYSQAGVGSEEYRMVDKQAPYDPPSAGEGGKNPRVSEKGEGTGRSGEGPEASAAGRKPRGKK